MDIQKFWSLLEKESLHFSRVTSFEDPFEGRIAEYNQKMGREMYSTIKDKFQTDEQFEKFLETRSNFEMRYQTIEKHTLVNCWNLNEYESALMWKSYSTNNSGVAIQSTYTKLSQSFQKTSDKIFIGMVAYTDFTKEWMDESNAYAPFMHKRKSFENEQELRCITSLPDDDYENRVLSDSDKEREKINPSKPIIVNSHELTENGKFVKVNLTELIENIYIAPLSSNEFECMVNSITEKLQPELSKRIKKSDLYTLR
jgi:hypothetical protein